MQRLFPTLALITCLSAAGCATSPSPSTPTVDGFRPDGSGGPNPEQMEALNRGDGDGVVMRFEPGDELVLDVRAAGDVIRSREDSTLTFVVEQAVDVWMGPDGVRLRAEGGAWKQPLDFLRGSVTTGLTLNHEQRANRATLSVEASRH